MDQYLIILVILGAAIFSVAWMPKISKKNWHLVLYFLCSNRVCTLSLGS